MGSATEKRGHIVTSSHIGWAHTHNDPCDHNIFLLLAAEELDASLVGEEGVATPKKKGKKKGAPKKGAKQSAVVVEQAEAASNGDEETVAPLKIKITKKKKKKKTSSVCNVCCMFLGLVCGLAAIVKKFSTKLTPE